MGRQAVTATQGARGFDTISAIGPAQASRLKSAGYDFAVRYLGSLSDMEVSTLNDAGIAVMGVGYGNADYAFDGASAVVNARDKAKLPPGTSLWMDLESRHEPAEEIIQKSDHWYDTVAAAGYLPGIYVGAGCVLNAQQIYALKFRHYWRSCSLVPKPQCGWGMVQLFKPNVIVAGVQIDMDIIESDYRERLPAWCVAA